jgi:hypothetical protein
VRPANGSRTLLWPTHASGADSEVQAGCVSANRPACLLPSCWAPVRSRILRLLTAMRAAPDNRSRLHGCVRKHSSNARPTHFRCAQCGTLGIILRRGCQCHRLFRFHVRYLLVINAGENHRLSENFDVTTTESESIETMSQANRKAMPQTFKAKQDGMNLLTDQGQCDRAYGRT